MNRDEVLAVISEVNNDLDGIRLKLYRIEQCEGYKELGFEAMEGLIESDYFTKARSSLYRALHMARVEFNVTGAVGYIPENHAAALNKFPAENQLTIYQAAAALADGTGKKLTAKHIAVAGEHIGMMISTGTYNGETHIGNIMLAELAERYRQASARRKYLVNGRAIVNFENNTVTIPLSELPDDYDGKPLYFSVWATEEAHILQFVDPENAPEQQAEKIVVNL